MSSSFGWLDTDHSQRRLMLNVVDLFRERDTVDEIGVSAIRDTISDILFPRDQHPAHPDAIRAVRALARGHGRVQHHLQHAASLLEASQAGGSDDGDAHRVN